MPRNSNRTEEQRKAFRDVLENGGTIEAAKLAAGYSAFVAKKGRKGLPKDLLVEMANAGRRYIDVGKAMSAQDQENLVRGRLIVNAVEGKDSGVNSLKLLGQDKRVNMFVADSVAGVVVIEAPRVVPTIEAVPVAELPENV